MWSFEHLLPLLGSFWKLLFFHLHSPRWAIATSRNGCCGPRPRRCPVAFPAQEETAWRPRAVPYSEILASHTACGASFRTAQSNGAVSTNRAAGDGEETGTKAGSG